MSERIYMLVVGVCILASLYFDIDFLIYSLAALLVFEGLSNIRLTTMLQRARHVTLDPGLVLLDLNSRFAFEAFRMWRIIVALVLVVTFALIHELGYDMLWFFPWFMGFAIIGAGASGVCPGLLALRRAGFR
jgi:hypothetical protein